MLQRKASADCLVCAAAAAAAGCTALVLPSLLLQPAASKPLPPWLMSSYKQQHGVQPQQPVSVAEQVKAEGGGLMGPGIKQDPAALKEEVKSESKQVGRQLHRSVLQGLNHGD